MAEVAQPRNWTGRAVFAALAFAVIFVQLLPLQTLPSTWAGPDVLLAMTVVWVSRRPEHVPLLLVAGLFLLIDLLFQRPPGLMATLVLALTEFLRARTNSFRSLAFGLEWGTVAMGIVAVTLANRFVLMLVVLPQAPLGLTLSQMILTILIYPVVAALAYAALGMRRATPGEFTAFGGRT
jgi:rod shape-determining protein MreD